MEYVDPAIRPAMQVKANSRLLYTYDVEWKASEVRWASRWDIYLSMNNQIPNRVHWFSIVNSLVIVLILTTMIAMILIRNLCRDIRRYNAVNREEEEDTGWKLVHTDVFRPPAEYRMLFCVCVGTGAQLLVCCLLTVLFASVGFLSPAARGSLLVALLLLYALTGSFSGYTSACLFKTFKGKTWQRCTTLTAFLFPGVSFVIFLVMDFMMSSYHSTGAVPFTSLVSLVSLWIFVSVPLVFLGAFVGYRREPLEFPVRFSVTPRPIPEQPWYLGTYFLLLMGGLLPFGACFVEVYFIMSSLWLGQYYYVFGFLFMVLIILLVTCAETSIVFCYFQLCNEDYRWWWRSFLVPGSTGLYVFLYSCVYFARLEANLTVTYFLYFGYMALVSGGIALVTGTAGFAACLWFTRKIYSSIKVE
uniref:Transmembrane 9 superfamily member n=1 Tax=Pinguiococcus pyrenoidosus TaxID=172671 RepID=A0A7R9U2A2_9STRA